MKKTEKGVVVRKAEVRQVVKPTKAAVTPTQPVVKSTRVVVPRPSEPAARAAPDADPPIPPALARALAHAAEPRTSVAAPTADSLSAVKVFWATFGETRNELGERITDWLERHAEFIVLDCAVTQSADSGFHCLTVTLFLGGDPTRYLSEPPEQRW